MVGLKEKLKNLEKQIESKKSKTQTQEIRKNPYEVLGIDSMSMKSQIKLAYRHQLSLYHPDKVNHLGEEIQKIAEKRTKEIIEAYEDLKNRD